MRVPEWVVLWGLILLCAHGHTSWSEEEKGDWCAYWPHGRESPIRIFRCPFPHDAADDKFCCGTCSLPYCCPVKGARVTEDWCRHLDPWKASFIPAPKPINAFESLVLTIFLVSGCGFLLMLIFCWRRNPNYHWHPEMLNAGNMDWLHWREIHPPSPPLPTRPLPPPPPRPPPPPPMRPLPPYNGEPPPPYSFQEGPSHRASPTPSPVHHHYVNCGNSEEIVMGPLVHRNVSTQGSDPALEADHRPVIDREEELHQ